MEQIIPNHIAIIMDGNGRWAKLRGKKRSFGHLNGSKNLERLALYALKKGVKVLSVYAFSTDNFKRSEEEVDYLMNLFITMFNKKMSKIIEKDVRVVFSGRKENLRSDVIDAMDKIVSKTKNNKSGILNVCLNYGAQEEIVDATKNVVNLVCEGKLNIDELNRDNYYKYLYQELPPVDLLIRTSGEYRISNFMAYQLAYAEFYFTDTLFPDFDSHELDLAIECFNKRDRRFGNAK